MECINLKKRFGKRYRIDHEESFRAEGRRAACPELMILLCKYGDIYAADGRMLAASVDGHPKIAGKLRRLECGEVVQDGDFGELTATFHMDDFPKVEKIMRPRRRRQVSPTERERLKAIGFRKGTEPHTDVQYRGRTGDPRASPV